MIKKVLVANRGEIACRVIKTCKEMGIKTVAVYSSADKGCPHVFLADEAYLLGPPPPLESYLNIDKIIEITKKSNAEAIHPGYGFLAENPAFARRCEEENIIFIGPSSRTLALVGDKIEARKTVHKEGLPVIPGMMGSAKDIQEFKQTAHKLGYPVMIKASGGGGGKGMRIVYSEAELEEKILIGRSEAKTAFGDDTVYLEKYLEEPRHIEVQILADKHGNVVHLCERECSIQRRHQKIIEESPSVFVDPQLRNRICETACKIARTVGYTNAGTVEFLVDENKNFYFLEVNARIQVEHPVTEMVTGKDIVREQILIASGEKISFKQADVNQRGHAIESRIYAEDPDNMFLPCFGKILFVKEPHGHGIRVDSGIYSGIEVSPYYDPILSKLICHAEDRYSAIAKMRQALSEYVILGIKTPIGFLINVMEHPEFINGQTTTRFLDKYFAQLQKKADINYAIIAAGLCEYLKTGTAGKVSTVEKQIKDPWFTIGRWEIGGSRI